jgi:hypothetical protein
LTKIQIISWAGRGLSCIPSVRRIQRKNIYRGKSRNRPRLISFYKEEFPGTDTSVDFYSTVHIEEIPGTNPPSSTFIGSAVFGCIYGETPDPSFVYLMKFYLKNGLEQGLRRC